SPSCLPPATSYVTPSTRRCSGSPRWPDELTYRPEGDRQGKSLAPSRVHLTEGVFSRGRNPKKGNHNRRYRRNPNTAKTPPSPRADPQPRWTAAPHRRRAGATRREAGRPEPGPEPVRERLQPAHRARSAPPPPRMLALVLRGARPDVPRGVPDEGRAPRRG